MVGQLTSERHYGGTGTIQTRRDQLAFDERGNVTDERAFIFDSGTTRQLRTKYSYNEAGQISKIFYPANISGGVSGPATYTYDNRTGLPIKLNFAGTDYVQSQTYNGAGQPTVRVQANGAKRQFDYDASTGRLKRLKFGTGGSTTNVQHLYITQHDTNGNIERMRDYRNAGQWQCYEYDFLDRLKAGYTAGQWCNGNPDNVGEGSYDENYTYTSPGNVKTWTGKGTFSYGTNANNTPGLHAVTKIQQGSTTNAQYGYDVFGNQTSRKIGTAAQQNLTYDHQNKVTQVTQGTNTTTFRYYSNGTRAQVTEANGDRRYYHPGGLFDAVVQGSTVKVNRNLSFAGEVVVQHGSYGINHVVGDHVGSPMKLVRVSNGTVLDTQLYKPFGEHRYTTNLATDIDFTKQRKDKDTGLHYFGARYYDSYAGRFTQPDTYVTGSTAATHNRYTYTLNNPVRYIDPTGHFFKKALKATAEFAGGAVNGVIIKPLMTTGEGLADFIEEPRQFTEGLNVAKSMVEEAGAAGTAKGIINAVVIEPIKGCFGGGVTAAERGESCGEIAGEVLGTKGAGAVTRKTVNAADEVADASRVVDNITDSQRAVGCNSFVPGTEVLMADGSTKPIEDIELGEHVWAHEPETGKEGARQVTHLITGHGNKTLIDITIDEHTVTATDEHPIWLPRQVEWVDAEELQPGDLVLDHKGEVAEIDEVSVRQVSDQTVYNLTVEDLHTFFVASGPQSVLTHNSNCDLPSELSGGDAVVDVYYGLNKKGDRVYVGISNDVDRRQREHGDKFALSTLTTQPVTRGEARAIEQAEIAANRGKFQNVRNSISPNHSYYQQAVDWGTAWLRDFTGF